MALGDFNIDVVVRIKIFLSEAVEYENIAAEKIVFGVEPESAGGGRGGVGLIVFIAI